MFVLLGRKVWHQQPLRVWLEGATLHCIALFITTETSYQLVDVTLILRIYRCMNTFYLPVTGAC